MPVLDCQAKSEPLKGFHLTTLDEIRDVEKLLYQYLSYRGNVNTDLATLNLSAPNAAPVSAGIGDVIVYRANPMAVVSCKTWDEFNATFDIT